MDTDLLTPGCKVRIPRNFDSHYIATITEISTTLVMGDWQSFSGGEPAKVYPQRVCSKSYFESSDWILLSQKSSKTLEDFL